MEGAEDDPGRARAWIDTLDDATVSREAAGQAWLERTVARFDPPQLCEALRGRFEDLASPRAAWLVRLAEVVGDEPLYEELAESLLRQPGLEPERTYEILAVLQNSQALEGRPELLERLEELLEAIDEGAQLGQELGSLLEDPEVGPADLLEGLSRIGPEDRVGIIGDLAGLPVTEALVEALEVLALAAEPRTSAAAVSLLLDLDPAEPRVSLALRRLAAELPDSELWRRASGMAAIAKGRELAEPHPRLLETLLTSVDGRGRATIAVRSHSRGEFATAAFLCDVMRGIVAVVGRLDSTEAPGREWFAELVSRPDRDAVQGEDALTIRFLAGNLLLCSEEAPLELRYWLDRTLGTAFRAQPMDASLVTLEEAVSGRSVEFGASAAAAVLEACADWVEDDDLVYDLAEELLLRPGGAAPDPERDAGLLRLLADQALRGRLERDRRMLLWMVSFWEAADASELAAAARTLARLLDEPDQVGPGHSYLLALGIRSLNAAQDRLRGGRDLRQASERRRWSQSAWP